MFEITLMLCSVVKIRNVFLIQNLKMTASQEFMLKVFTFLLFGITEVDVHYFLNAVQHQSNGEIIALDVPQRKTTEHSIMKIPQLLSELLNHVSLFI